MVPELALAMAEAALRARYPALARPRIGQTVIPFGQRFAATLVNAVVLVAKY